MTFKQDYSEYLQSKHWKDLAEETRRLAGYRCQVCNSDQKLEVHHRTYERKGDEHQSDLVCLCHDCHERFHNKPRHNPWSKENKEFFELVEENNIWPFRFATEDLLYATYYVLTLYANNERLTEDFAYLINDLTFFNTRRFVINWDEPNIYYPSFTVGMDILEMEIENGTR